MALAASPVGTNSGPLGVTARAQYAALARLRWHMFSNGMRSTKGAFEFSARIIVFLIYAGMGLGLGSGAGASAYMIASNAQWQYLPIVFWAVCLLWQVLPIMLASFQEQFDLSILLRFPVSFPSFYLLYIVFGLVDASSIIGAFCLCGILVGVTAARPDLFLWTLLALAVFAAFNVFLVRAIFAWIDRWLAQRRTREILTAVFLLLMLSINLVNPAFHQKRHTGHLTPAQQEEALRQADPAYQLQHNPWLRTANSIQKWLPPGVAAVSVSRAAASTPSAAAGSMAMLALYAILAGGILLTRLRGEYRGENFGEAPKAASSTKSAVRVSPVLAASGLALSATAGLTVTASPRTAARPAFLDAFGPISAIVVKEVRTLKRTLPQLYAVGAPLILMVILSGGLLRHGPGTRTFAYAVPVCMVYALLGFTQLFYNNLGAEGAGINLIFLSPTPFRTTMLAKNIFHALMFLVIAIVGVILAIVRLGAPTPAVLASTAAWVLFALPSNLAAGDIFSILMPYRINPGRLTRQRGSQGNALLGLLVQFVVLSIGAVGFWIGWFFENPWIPVPIFVLFAIAAVIFWMRVLANTGTMANKRKDALIATLVKTD
jgi:ABC-2 type transport system permease protein